MNKAFMLALMEKHNIPTDTVEAKVAMIQEQARIRASKPVVTTGQVDSPPGVVRTLALNTTSPKDEDFEPEGTSTGEHKSLPLNLWNKAQLVAELQQAKGAETSLAEIIKRKKKA